MTAPRSRSRPAAGPGRRAGPGPARRRPGPRLGHAGPGGQDGADVGGPPPAERDRPVQARPGTPASPWAARSVFSSASSAASRVCPGRGGAGDERLGDRAERAELLLRRGLRPDRPARVRAAGRRSARRGPRPHPGATRVCSATTSPVAVMMTSSRPSSVRSRTCGADQPDRARSSGPRRTGRRTAGRPCGSPACRCWPAATAAGASSSRSVTSRSAGHRADLAVDRAVDLGAPRRGRGVRRGQVAERRLRHHQVGLGIADQVLHDPLRFRVRGLAEIGPEPVMARRTARTPRWAPPRWRPRRPSGSPSGRPAPCPAPRPAPRSTRPASPASSRPARRRRTARTGTATRPAPRRTRAARPRLPQSITRCSPGDHTAGRRPR